MTQGFTGLAGWLLAGPPSVSAKIGRAGSTTIQNTAVMACDKRVVPIFVSVHDVFEW